MTVRNVYVKSQHEEEQIGPETLCYSNGIISINYHGRKSNFILHNKNRRYVKNIKDYKYFNEILY